MWLFIAWLAVIPLVVINNSFEGAKVQVYLIGSIFLLVYWLIKILPKVQDLFTKSDTVFCAWLLILTLASVFGVHPMDSIVGGSYRRQGVIFFVALWILGKTIQLLGSNKKLLYRLVICTGFIESALLIIESILSPNKVLGTFGNGKVAAGFVALTLFMPKGVVPVFWRTALNGVNLVGVLVTQSVGAVLTAVVSVQNRKLLIMLLFIAALSILILHIDFQFYNPHEGRGTIWKLAVTSIRERPILGFGAESGEVVFDTFFKKHGTPLKGLMVERAHNIFLDVAMWSGIPGLVIFIYWIVIKLKEVPGSWRTRAVLGWFVFAFFQPLGVSHWLMLAIFLY